MKNYVKAMEEDNGFALFAEKFSQIIIEKLKAVFLRPSNKKTHKVGWLFGWILWHIKHFRLLNAKSTFIQIVSSTSYNSV